MNIVIYYVSKHDDILKVTIKPSSLFLTLYNNNNNMINALFRKMVQTMSPASDFQWVISKKRKQNALKHVTFLCCDSLHNYLFA